MSKFIIKISCNFVYLDFLELCFFLIQFECGASFERICGRSRIIAVINYTTITVVVFLPREVFRCFSDNVAIATDPNWCHAFTFMYKKYHTLDIVKKLPRALKNKARLCRRPRRSELGRHSIVTRTHSANFTIEDLRHILGFLGHYLLRIVTFFEVSFWINLMCF